MILSPLKIVTDGDMSANIISNAIILQTLSTIGFDIDWTGTPVGSFAIQVSNTYSLNQDGTVRNPGTWTDVALSTIPQALGASGNGYIDITIISAYAVRLVYMANSSSGTLNVTACGKLA